jgi:ABC-2 type transport system permease protein
MKGLLVKDFKLICQQKNFFIILLIVTAGLLFINDDVIFPLGFLTFVVSLFSVSTISYDEFDNGNAFLFTLPITRRIYAAEKYCLALILGCGGWAVSVILSATASIIQEKPLTADFFFSAFMILPIMIFINAITIPFQLKFGSDKGRIAIICSIGLLVVIGISVNNIAKYIFGIDILNMIDTLPPLSLSGLIAALMVFAAVVLLISLKISINILRKKEF